MLDPNFSSVASVSVDVLLGLGAQKPKVKKHIKCFVKVRSYMVTGSKETYKMSFLLC